MSVDPNRRADTNSYSPSNKAATKVASPTKFEELEITLQDFNADTLVSAASAGAGLGPKLKPECCNEENEQRSAGRGDARGQAGGSEGRQKSVAGRPVREEAVNNGAAARAFRPVTTQEPASTPFRPFVAKGFEPVTPPPPASTNSIQLENFDPNKLINAAQQSAHLLGDIKLQPDCCDPRLQLKPVEQRNDRAQEQNTPQREVVNPSRNPPVDPNQFRPVTPTNSQSQPYHPVTPQRTESVITQPPTASNPIIIENFDPTELVNAAQKSAHLLADLKLQPDCCDPRLQPKPVEQRNDRAHEPKAPQRDVINSFEAVRNPTLELRPSFVLKDRAHTTFQSESLQKGAPPSHTAKEASTERQRAETESYRLRNSAGVRNVVPAIQPEPQVKSPVLTTNRSHVDTPLFKTTERSHGDVLRASTLQVETTAKKEVQKTLVAARTAEHAPLSRDHKAVESRQNQNALEAVWKHERQRGSRITEREMNRIDTRRLDNDQMHTRRNFQEKQRSKQTREPSSPKPEPKNGRDETNYLRKGEALKAREFNLADKTAALKLKDRLAMGGPELERKASIRERISELSTRLKAYLNSLKDQIYRSEKPSPAALADKKTRQLQLNDAEKYPSRLQKLKNAFFGRVTLNIEARIVSLKDSLIENKATLTEGRIARISRTITSNVEALRLGLARTVSKPVKALKESFHLLRERIASRLEKFKIPERLKSKDGAVGRKEQVRRFSAKQEIVRPAQRSALKGAQQSSGMFARHLGKIRTEIVELPRRIRHISARFLAAFSRHVTRRQIKDKSSWKVGGRSAGETIQVNREIRNRRLQRRRSAAILSKSRVTYSARVRVNYARKARSQNVSSMRKQNQTPGTSKVVEKRFPRKTKLFLGREVMSVKFIGKMRSKPRKLLLKRYRRRCIKLLRKLFRNLDPSSRLYARLLNEFTFEQLEQFMLLQRRARRKIERKSLADLSDRE